MASCILPSLVWTIPRAVSAPCIIGRDADRALDFLFRFGKPVLAGQNQPEIDEGLRILRIVLDGVAGIGLRLRDSPLLAVEHAQVVLRFGVLRVERQGLL